LSHEFGLSNVFVGVFVVAILRNAAEHATAISAARNTDEVECAQLLLEDRNLSAAPIYSRLDGGMNSDGRHHPCRDRRADQNAEREHGNGNGYSHRPAERPELAVIVSGHGVFPAAPGGSKYDNCGRGTVGAPHLRLTRFLRGRSHDRRSISDRDSPGRTNGNAVSNPRIRV
jgi:hypothetical protein